MQITKETIEHVAKLSRLSLTEQEIIKYTSEISDILNFVDKLNELDTTGVEPTAYAIPMQNAFRKDEIRPSFDREKILQNAPAQLEGCFLVPKVVE